MLDSLRHKAYSWLRTSEKIFKTDMVYLAKGSFWLSAGNIVSSAASLALSLIFANFLLPEQYGQYKYILSVFGILTVFTLADIGTAVIQATARGKGGCLQQALKAEISWGLIGSLLGLIISAYQLFLGNNLLAAAFLLCAMFVPFMDSFSIYDSFLQGKKMFKQSNIFGIIGKIIATTLLIIAILITKNVLIIIFVYFLSWTLLRYLFFKKTEKSFQANTITDSEAIAYGKHLSLIKGVGIAAGSLGNIFIFNLLGGSALAIITIAIAPIERMRSVVNFVKVLSLPKFSQDCWEVGEQKNFWKKILPFILLIVGAVITYIIIAPLAFKILFPKYQAALLLSQIYAPSLILTGVNVIQSNILRAKKATKQIYWLSGFEIIGNTLVTLALIYFWGILGMIGAIYFIKIGQFILLNYFIFFKKIEKS